MIKQFARWILRSEMARFAETLLNLRAENSYLQNHAAETNQRWVALNQLMAHRAQQERGLFCVRQGENYLPILAVKTRPGSVWELSVGPAVDTKALALI
jgi:hypothetical protein